MSNQAVNKTPNESPSAMNKFLNFIERTGNKIPDPALLFFWGLILVWVLSAVFSQFEFGLIHPVSGQAVEVNNLLTGEASQTSLRLW